MAGQVWSFMNLKGGVGKTTLSANICRSLLNITDARILLVDTDPQCSLTLIFDSEQVVNERPTSKTFFDILCRETTDISRKIELCSETVFSEPSKQIDLVPSHIDLIRPMIASMMARTNGTDQPERFAQMAINFENMITKAKELYDLVVIDTNPSGNLATYLGIKNSQFIIAPVTSDRFSIRGIALMRDVFALEFEWLEHEPWRLVPVINKVQGPNEAKEVAAVRDLLQQRKVSSHEERALRNYVQQSGFLQYSEKKTGFAQDRKAHAFNWHRRNNLVDNLDLVAEELMTKTKFPRSETE